MSVWGLIEGTAEVLGGPAVTAAIEGGKALTKLFGGTETIAGQATMSPEALVKMITSGAGPEGLEGERQENSAKAQTQNQIETDTRRHMTTLESAWTGGGADAAREKLQAATVPVANSSQAMVTNAGVITSQIDSFTNLKNSLHSDVTDNPPQKSFWDTVTPWDTDTENAINANNAKVQENLQAYNTYAQSSQANAPQLKTDYGQVTNLGGGNFEIQQPNLPPDKPGPGPGNPNGTENITGTNNQRTSSVGTTGTNVPKQSTGQTGRTDSPVGSTGIPTYYPGDTGRTSGSLDDTTHSAGYTTPGTTGSSYTPSTFGSSFGPGSSGGADYTSGGLGGGGAFGPIGGGGAAGGSGGAYGSGSGSGGSTGSGALTGGKATGGVAAEAGAAGAASRAGAAGAAGRGGASGMGGMGHGGKGQGGDDEEHQRPSWLVEEDPEGIFGTDEKTAPPVIGL
ncbi:hypothetical protein HFP15_35345 [Amycolatopsis sp. K13G38]|uniref:PPE domain-containing protein n=1 Tax=Amycolatopsis acididurans TaxID=2724524 RepID=A0ABX1JEU6_9PSEU|nr:hypothetical protein [Amycolatopsis acididurans]NKQ58148.1 hypothetical protein [Amycolatopsis acididurans]